MAREVTVTIERASALPEGAGLKVKGRMYRCGTTGPSRAVWFTVGAAAKYRAGQTVVLCVTRVRRSGELVNPLLRSLVSLHIPPRLRGVPLLRELTAQVRPLYLECARLGRSGEMEAAGCRIVVDRKGRGTVHLPDGPRPGHMFARAVAATLARHLTDSAPS